MVRPRSAAFLALAAMACSVPGGAWAAGPSTVPEVIGICSPVIDEEYNGNNQHYGDCIKAVGDYLVAIGAASDAANPLIADLVVELAKLYRYDVKCKIAKTELPIAIQNAALKSTDKTQQAQILEVRQTIVDCTDIQTAAIDTPIDGIGTGSNSAQQSSPF